jgi:signal transduction histidine kinase
MLNFPLDESVLPSEASSPVMVFGEGHMLLCSSREIRERGTVFGTVSIVQNLQNEFAFLRLLGILLLGANILGAFAALLVGRFASRRMLAPVSHMIEATRKIDESNLDTRLDVPEADDELKSLSLTINSMLDRMSAAYRQQGRFVADVSHELRTPLAVVQGNVDLLSRWGSGDKTVLRDSILALQKQTSYMNQLVENLLLLARFDSMQSQLNVSTFPVGDLFGDLLKEQALIDTEHGYQMSMPDPEDTVRADRTMIKQMLRALIDNSVKYTPKDGSIRLGFRSDEKSAVFTVSDDGIGMEPEHSDHIFERFYRVDQARTRATGGMGLGLSIVAAIARAHGGGVSVESEPGVGTTVSVILPK